MSLSCIKGFPALLFGPSKRTQKQVGEQPTAKPIAVGEGNSDNMGRMHVLPQELICHILQQQFMPQDLARWAQVNRLCYHIANDNALWKEALLTAGPLYSVWPVDNFRVHAINWVLQTRLLSAAEHNDEALSRITSRFAQATEIHLASSMITTIGSVSRHLLYIQRFTLETKNPEGFEHLQKGALTPLTKAHPEITHLNLDECPKIPEDEIVASVVSCRRLVELRIDCRQLTSDSIKKIVHSQPHLEKLIVCSAKKVNDKALIAIAKYCPKIRLLNIDGCNKVTSRGLQALSILPCLSSLILYDCNNPVALNQWMRDNRAQFQALKNCIMSS